MPTSACVIRLLSRQRETVGEVEARIQQALASTPTGVTVVRILNEASLASAHARTVAALTGATKYSLWLLPAETDAAHSTAAKMIQALAASAASTETSAACAETSAARAEASAACTEAVVKTFPPHITLVSGFVGFQRHAVEVAAAIASAIKPIAVRFGGVNHSEHTFRAVTVAVERTAELLQARGTATSILEAYGHTPSESAAQFSPHLSLLYGKHAEQTRAKAADLARRGGFGVEGALRFTACKLALVATTTADYHCWPEIATFVL